MRQKLSNFKAEFFKALGRPRRISILDALREGELTVNAQFIEAIWVLF